MTFEQKKQIVIDNSFKVDCNINMTLKEAYEKGFNRGLSKAPKTKVEQPQGDWKLVADDKANLEYIFKCSECGREVRVYDASTVTKIYPFCHCGAEMSGGAR